MGRRGVLAPLSGTKFTCFTSTKVQILTPGSGCVGGCHGCPNHEESELHMRDMDRETFSQGEAFHDTSFDAEGTRRKHRLFLC